MAQSQGICLYDSDRRILSDGKWLYGTHLSAVQFFLKEQFQKVNGLQDTVLVLKNNHRLLPGSVQVLHVNGNHWLTVSTLDSGVDVTIYDSLHFTLSEDTKAQLAKLLKSQKKQLLSNLLAQTSKLVVTTVEYLQLLTPHLWFMDRIQAAMFTTKK